MRLYVPLTRTEFDQLRDRALIERRRPQDQAAVLLAQALADEPAHPATESAPAPVAEAITPRTPPEAERVPA